MKKRSVLVLLVVLFLVAPLGFADPDRFTDPGVYSGTTLDTGGTD